jgi:methylated-DNA-[protein]-cysteine S-methyltransferase
MSRHPDAVFIESCSSPVGRVGFQFAIDGELVAISLPTDAAPADSVTTKRPGGAPKRAEVEAWLSAFMEGQSIPWTGRWRLPGTSPFYRKVYGLVVTIPPGMTMGYGEVAAACGSPGGARAVGTAMRQNTLPLLVPCHRVLAANGIGGFAGGVDGALDLKVSLLALEANGTF